MVGELDNVIRRFRDLKCVVLGDAMLDRYSSGACQRLCPEAPVPVVDVVATHDQAGGAANSAVNLKALGASVTLVSAVGLDEPGLVLRRVLKQAGICVEHIHNDRSRSTLAKHRVLAGSQLVVRFDAGDTHLLEARSERRVIDSLEQVLPSADLVVIADYAYGSLTPGVLDVLTQWRSRFDRTLVVDSKNLPRFRHLGVTAVKPNYKEVQALLGRTLPGVNGDRWRTLLPWGDEILQRCGARMAAVTLDSDGAIVFRRGKSPYRTIAKRAADPRTAGAGDTFMAALGLALASGAAEDLAAELATSAAAVVVGKEHTASCSDAELLAVVGGSKVCHSYAELMARTEAQRRIGRRIVLTSGCFDVLHSGHVNCLEKARALGDMLIVGVNTDESVQALKGPHRPINSLPERLAVLQGLGCVDLLCGFPETTPHRLIRAVRPDTFVKGGDYRRETLPEASLVEELGGRIVIVPHVAGRSTTNVIERVRNQSACASIQST